MLFAMFMCFVPCYICMFMFLKLCFDAIPSAFIALYLLFMPLSCVRLLGRV